MKIVSKTIIALAISVLLLFVAFFIWLDANSHPDPLFNIGNNFPQTVTVYLDGHNKGKIDSGKSEIFYPGEVIKPNELGLLVEFKSNSGTVLFSKLYNWDEYRAIIERVHGLPYWIGPFTE
jgi:hypothetical protein